MERGQTVYCHLYEGTEYVITQVIDSEERARRLGNNMSWNGGEQIHLVSTDKDKPRRSTISGAIIRGPQWSIFDAFLLESEITALETKADRLAEEEKQKRKTAEQQLAEREEKGKIILAEKQPKWAKAVIIANQDVNESDIMTDYFHHSTKRTVIIGWSKHTRDLFSEMRKAAENCGMPELAHLGPGKDIWQAHLSWDHNHDDPDAKERCFISGMDHYYKDQYIRICMDDPPNESPIFSTEEELDTWLADHQAPSGTYYKKSMESVEHRQKWSMGGGYFLKAGGRHSDGWSVKKSYIGDHLASTIVNPDNYKVPEKKKQKSKNTPMPADGDITITLNEAKNGIEIRFPGKPDEDIRQMLKDAGWKWSRFNKCWYAPDKESNRIFAEQFKKAA